jgi:predicted Zn-dependent peptidase
MTSINYAISASGYPVFHYQKADSLICHAQITANVGSAHEDPDSYGAAHFLEHLCFQGTPSKNKHQISREMDLLGSFNAGTNYFCTSYYFEALCDNFDPAFKILKESVFDSNYPEHEFEKESRVIVEEWRMYDNYPSETFNNYTLDKCYGYQEGHPIIGTEESIRAMTPEKIHRFRNRWYGRQNMYVLIVNNLSFEDTLKIVDKYLPASREVETAPVCLSSLKTTGIHSFETDRFDQAIYGIVQPWASLVENFERGYKPYFTIKALNKHLYEKIRDDLGLCYGVSTSKITNYNNSYLFVTMLTNKDYLAKAQEELFKSFEEVKSNGFPEELFRIAKNKAMFQQLKAIQDIGGISSTMNSLIYSCKDIDWILNVAELTLDPNYLKKKADELELEDLQRYAVEHLASKQSCLEFSMVPVKKNIN